MAADPSDDTDLSRDAGAPALSAEDFRGAMRAFPSGVVVATTVDADGKHWGFTASSFSSVSLDPPLVLVCVGRQAGSYAAFKTCTRLSINILGGEHESLAMQFATRGGDKFAGATLAADHHGVPLIAESVVSLSCHPVSALDHGDHLVLIAQVDAVHGDATRDALVYYQREFWRFETEGVLVPVGR